MIWRRKRKQNDEGLYLGRLWERERKLDEVFYRGKIHAITIGPNGSGKGTGLIVPNVLSLRRSLLIDDPKGETCAITYHARAKLGRVLVINPFNILADRLPYLKSHRCGVLGHLDPAQENFTDDCVAIGQALVKETQGSDGSFFGGSAQDFVAAAIMHTVLLLGKKATLGRVRELITTPFTETGLQRIVGDMICSPCAPLRAKAGRFARDSRSIQDIISTAINETRSLDSPPLQRDLSGPSFDWDMMKREIVTVYLILPADRLETHAIYLRVIVTAALRALLRSPPSQTLPPVTFILDEFAALGYLPPIENAMGIARGFGVQLWPILQDLSQLKALYRDRWQSFIGNAGLLTAYAPRDMFTANYLSDMCGKISRDVPNRSMNDRGQINWGSTPHDFPRYRPEELMRLPPGRMLNLMSGTSAPFFTDVPGYWERPFGRKASPNPYYQGE